MLVQHLSSMSVKTSFISDELFTVNVTYVGQIDGRLLAICCPPNYKTRLKTMPITKRTTIIIIIHYYIRERESLRVWSDPSTSFALVYILQHRTSLYIKQPRKFNRLYRREEKRNSPTTPAECRFYFLKLHFTPRENLNPKRLF
jgi:hypothetical protein